MIPVDALIVPGPDNTDQVPPVGVDCAVTVEPTQTVLELKLIAVKPILLLTVIGCVVKFVQVFASV